MGGGKRKSLAAQWASSGGVDLADQRISSYKKHFKTCTWYLVVFFHGLEQCCLNSFISMQATPGHQDAKCTQLRFRAIDWWINLCKVKGKALNPSSSRSLLHYLVRRDEKQACIVHTQEVRQKHVLCARNMCEEPCFHRYHTMQEFKFDDPLKSREKSGRKRAKTHDE